MADRSPAMMPRQDGQKQRQMARREGRWDPFALLEQFEEEVAGLWGRPMGSWPVMRPLQRMAQMPARWTPRMDVYEKDNMLIVKADLPGVKKEDVNVEMDDGDLVIRGETRQEQEVKDEDFRRVERSYGSFYRRLPLSADVDTDQIQANMNDGVLEVRIPKPANREPEAKRIQVT